MIQIQAPKCFDFLYTFSRSFDHPFFFKEQFSDFSLKSLMTLRKEAEMISNHFYCSENIYWTNTLRRTALCICRYDSSSLGALTERTVLTSAILGCVFFFSPACFSTGPILSVFCLPGIPQNPAPLLHAF